MNKQIKHIAYYTKKVAQEGTKVRPTYTSFRNSLRCQRLLLYKKLLNEIIINSLQKDSSRTGSHFTLNKRR